MATIQQKVCDVFGTASKEIEKYRVTLTHLATEGGDDDQHVIGVDVELCPRGLERLKKFIDRGTSSPNKKDNSNDDS